MSIFSRVKAEFAKTSLFNLSHEVKNTCKFGMLTPILCQEILPGDTWRVKTEILSRMLAMKAPTMHNIDVYTHFFFVPNRIVWKDWEEFVTQSLNGTHQSDVPQLPYILLHGAAAAALSQPGSLGDYLGIKNTDNQTFDNPQGQGQIYCQVLPFLAYNRIWSDYYRDENLDEDIDSAAWDLPGGDVTNELAGSNSQRVPGLDIFNVRYRAWRKDYFTSALPWTQKGEDVTLPISGNLDVTGRLTTSSYSGNLNLDVETHGVVSSQNIDVTFATRPGSNRIGDFYATEGGIPERLTSQATGEFSVPGQTLDVSGLSADMSSASAVTINELRRANALQKWSEANARGGTRYIEQLLTHFGVVSDDARLQRAEYLGGGKSPIVISEVLQNSASTIDGSETPQGNMSGHAISASVNHAFKRHFKEHGYVIGIMSIMPRANYMQGIPRHFLKRDVFDFGWPLLAHLGEQPIYDQEIYADGAPDFTNNPNAQFKEFGYTPRYAEYKFINDQIAGDFRSSLSYWHAARDFENAPLLNSDFISTKNFDPGIFPSYETDYLLNQIYLDIKATRKLPKYGTPRL